MSDLTAIKVHRGQRAAKKQSRKEVKDYVTTPPKYKEKESKQDRYARFESRMGYDY